MSIDWSLMGLCVLYFFIGGIAVVVFSALWINKTEDDDDNV